MVNAQPHAVHTPRHFTETPTPKGTSWPPRSPHASPAAQHSPQQAQAQQPPSAHCSPPHRQPPIRPTVRRTPYNRYYSDRYGRRTRIVISDYYGSSYSHYYYYGG